MQIEPESETTATGRGPLLLRDPGVWLFVVASFTAACLIFLIQPMVGKRVLPWFGGAAAVWALCLAFYQTILFAGYAYAHLLSTYAKPPLQVAIHAVALMVASLALPVLPGERWKPDGSEDPSVAILAALLVHVAPPFLVLAGTAPLVQSWFARGYSGRSPYPLYAVSNAGSLLALLSYPFLIEPHLSLSDTSRAWSVAFVVTGMVVLLCAVLAWRRGLGTSGLPLGTLDRSSREPIRLGQAGLWIGLSGCAVALLMSVTNELCLDVASVPFLWILPLSTYLVTFILCFGAESERRRSWSLVLTVFFLAFQLSLGPWSSFFGNFSPIANSVYVQIVVQCGLLFSACTLLHNELYRARPEPESLTTFYLCVSGGGALGGLFVGLLAPYLFDDYVELLLVLVLGAALLIIVWWNDASAWLHRDTPRWRWLVAGATMLLLIVGLGHVFVWPERGLLYRERSFFGVLRVRQISDGGSEQRHLYSGTTLHGTQLLQMPRRPISYYGHVTGIGVALGPPDAKGPRRVGVIGLGIGSLAAYGRAGDRFRFYEIDQVVTWLARDSGYFSFLSQSAAEIEIVQGDARIALEREAAGPDRAPFDVLVVDAFTSDAVPVHLITRESLTVYEDALAPDGLLAFHLSSRYFDLVPIVARLAEDAGLQSVVIQNELLPDQLSSRATWLFMSRDPRRLRTLERTTVVVRQRRGLASDALVARRIAPATLRETALWTDDYTDLFSALLPLPIKVRFGSR